MGFLNFIKRKASTTAISVAQGAMVNHAVWMDRNFSNFAKEAYIQNAIAYRCISMIASNAANVWWKLYDGAGREITKHPLLDVINKPSQHRTGAEFFEEFFTYYLLAGNAYVEKVTTTPFGEPLELYALRPDRLSLVMNTQGLPKEYIHEANGIQTKFPVSITGQCNLLHMRAPHPTNDFYGLSSVEPAAKSVDLHNEASTHNLALLQNGASPSGAMVFRGNITQEQMPAIEEKLLAKFQGTRNSGKPLVVGGDWTWNQLGLSPKDLDFTEGKLQAAREICTAFGVPHELIVEGNSTYNNKSEAKLMLWDETILPLLDKFNKTVLNWLLSSYGAETRGWFFNYDMDSITALAPRRWMQSQKVLDEWASGLITRDEARARLGHDTVGDKKGGSEFATGNPPQG